MPYPQKEEIEKFKNYHRDYFVNSVGITNFKFFAKPVFDFNNIKFIPIFEREVDLNNEMYIELVDKDNQPIDEVRTLYKWKCCDKDQLKSYVSKQSKNNANYVLIPLDELEFIKDNNTIFNSQNLSFSTNIIKNINNDIDNLKKDIEKIQLKINGLTNLI